MFYSKSTNGFYNIDIHGNNIPTDAVQITTELHITLLDGQAKGKVITADYEGFPVLIDAPSIEQDYKQKRLAEYPPITDYIDGLVKNDKTQINKYIEDCLKVKAKYPK